MLAETILDIKQAEALAGKTAEEMSTPTSGGEHVFVRSQNYPAYECRIVCTDLNDREVQMSVEVRMHPRGKQADTENVHFETILLRRPSP